MHYTLNQFYALRSPLFLGSNVNRSFNRKILSYVKKLRAYIRKQKFMIAKLKAKIKKLTRCQKVSPAEVEKKNEEKPTKKESKEGGTGRDEIVSSYLDDIKQAATEGMIKQMGLQYEPVSGLYYDATTGYYFNPEYNLYYDGNNGCYLKYNEESFEYEFYSQVATIPSTSQTSKKESKAVIEKTSDLKDKRRAADKKSSRRYSQSESETSGESTGEREDGELSGSATTISDDSEPSPSQRVFARRKDIATKYPPSLRLVVKETDVKQLKKGMLFIVTYKGGTLGREGQHDVLIPDINVSKSHLKFYYNHKQRQYECQDIGSRNGTLVNGERMSESQVESERIPLLHESVIELHNTKILCHIHKGMTTCTKCEPGLIQTETKEKKEPPPSQQVLTHKQQLKQIQRRYGLEKEKYVAEDQPATAQQSYNDRADERRKKVGSSCHGEKTESTSLEASIASSNKGYKMLKKLGWNQGESLGKSSEGILEPVPLVNNNGTRGLGNAEPDYKSHVPRKLKAKYKILEKTQKRYQECHDDAPE